jgi:hypothetical protein
MSIFAYWKLETLYFFISVGTLVAEMVSCTVSTQEVSPANSAECIQINCALL